MEATPKCHFVMGFHIGSPEIGSFIALKAHNFLCKLALEVRFKAKL